MHFHYVFSRARTKRKIRKTTSARSNAVLSVSGQRKYETLFEIRTDEHSVISRNSRYSTMTHLLSKKKKNKKIKKREKERKKRKKKGRGKETKTSLRLWNVPR